VVEVKHRRAVALGPLVRLIFDNFETALFHVQELARVRRLRDPAQLQTEIDLYNELQPRPGELTATAVLEDRDGRPARLPGLENSLILAAGAVELARSERIETFIPAEVEEPGGAGLYFLRFAFAGPALERFLSTEEPVRLACADPVYPRACDLPKPLLEELRADVK
jgi:hypothetical protein